MGIYAFAGGKGGVGKTTTTLNVGVSLARNGYEVTVVDADLAMTDLGYLLEDDLDAGIHDVLAGECSLSKATIEGPHGVQLIPGHRSLEALRDADPSKLAAVFGTLSKDDEFVLVDTGAGLSHEVLVSLGAADGAFVVTTPKSTAVGDATQTEAIADRVDGTLLGTVVTRVRSPDGLESVADEMDTPVVGSVPEETRLSRSPLIVADGPVPDEHSAAAGYRHLARLLEACDDAADPQTVASEFDEPPVPPADFDPADVEPETTEQVDSPTVDEGDGAEADDGPVGLFGSLLGR
ncbi:AAA family ATPase [Haloarculaceae archaeon H-GB2-1]|nr:AAA family ATPase [Haloarculaceae archaeon H-GB1-1]MEA5406854.1 AAA family ATPase [Haloarculaceae archaeon H-GB2-1]